MAFEETPAGMTSIGQTHAAVLKVPTDAIVKARRPRVPDWTACHGDVDGGLVIGALLVAVACFLRP